MRFHQGVCMNVSRFFICICILSFWGTLSWSDDKKSLEKHQKSAVWKVSKGDYHFYLAGTMHVLKAEDYPLPSVFDHAFQEAEIIVVETDIGQIDSKGFQKKLDKKSQYEKNQDLFTLLSPEADAALQAYCNERHIAIEAFKNMRVGLVVASISMTELMQMGINQRGVDEHYLMLAHQQNKTVLSLESIDDQINFLVTMGAGQESEFLLQSLDELKSMPEDINQLRKAWFEGDAALLNTLMIEDMKKTSPYLYQQLLRQRNLNWLPTLENLINQTSTVMVLVGAAHIAGTDGLLVLLSQTGFTIEHL